MATLTLTNSYGDDWPPDALEGGTITARSGTAMTYTSAMGYTVTLRGTGLVYDDDGMPAAGLVTRVIVRGPAGAYSDFTGVSTDFAQAGMKIFGYDRDNGGFQDPDGFGFFRNLMRGNDVVNGSADYDDLRGGAGNDTVNCGAGDDYCRFRGWRRQHRRRRRSRCPRVSGGQLFQRRLSRRQPRCRDWYRHRQLGLHRPLCQFRTLPQLDLFRHAERFGCR